MLRTSALGFPRMGEERLLKKSTESYWKGEISEEALNAAGRQIRSKNWLIQKEAGINIIPSNDFSFYDQMLDTTALLGAVPARYNWSDKQVDLSTYFAMARGTESLPAMEMTKWFDTNYHYIVPEFHRNQRFSLASDKPFNEFKEALSMGIMTRPVLIGPLTYLMLGKSKDNKFSALDLLDPLLEIYTEILKKFEAIGAETIQIDEPILVLDLDSKVKSAIKKAYAKFAKEIPGLPLILTTYFGELKDNLKLAAFLPVHGLHVDLIKASQELPKLVAEMPGETLLSLGIVEGRNIWKNDLAKSTRFLKPVIEKRGADKCIIATSCSLLFSPVDLEQETKLDPELKNWLSFSVQKLHEIELIRKALSDGEESIASELRQNQRDIASRKKSKKIHKKAVLQRLRELKAKDYVRKSPFKIRQIIQHERLGLPLLPTTTIGSFPQTPDIRQARASFKKGALSIDKYEKFLRGKIKECIERQIEIGFDVLVHGEAERNDMVEYFGEQLEGFAFTKSGWVQSYGTRYVKPPIVYGDVSRPKPMTVKWIKYSQSLTDKPVKGMLTGPITILQWSFVRDDQPRSETARQIALAIRDEVTDLEKMGSSIIQIDEPAIREGLPLKKSEWPKYLKWAVECFRLSSSGVQDKTQIHTHMCYSEFNDIIKSIAAMDTDVISIETSRSQIELLDAFVKFRYPNEIGPGVYDIHSPRVPSADEIINLLKKAASLLPIRNLWVNPDCGLKTRGWEETALSLKAMVKAAKYLRQQAGKATLCSKMAV